MKTMLARIEFEVQDNLTRQIVFKESAIFESPKQNGIFPGAGRHYRKLMDLYNGENWKFSDMNLRYDVHNYIMEYL